MTWLRARVWYVGGVVDCSAVEQFAALPDAILGAVGFRDDGTHDYVAGYDWYGWYVFADGWRLSGHVGDAAENLRQRGRYPGTVWREGILVSDSEMARVNREMRETINPPRPDDCVGCK